MKLFISYSSKDIEIINKYRDLFEKNGHEVWMAPKSIPLGESYAEAIPHGIEWCDYFLIFITNNCLASKWCRSEIDNARQKNKRIVPIFIENVKYNETFSFYLNDSQGIYFNDFSKDPILNIENNILPYLEGNKRSINPLIIQYNEKLSKKITNFNKVFTSLDLKIETSNDDFSNLDLMFDIYGDDVEAEFDLNSLVNNRNKYFIHGEAGAGKTTILKKIIIDAANYCLKNEINAFPVFLELSKVDSADSLFGAIVATLNIEKEEAIRLFKESHIIIALDGLDEFSMDNKDNRRKLIEAIDNIYNKYSCSIVIGCRTNSLPKDTDYKLVRIKPLTETQIIEFIHKYFGYFSISLDERRFYEWIKDITSGATITPLLLSIAIGLSKNNSVLNKNIDGLYKAYVERLLSKINKNKTSSDDNEYFYLASQLAFEMLIRSRTSIPLDEIFFENYASSYNFVEIIKDLASSELISINEERVSFIHASIMEYLGQIFASKEFDFVPKEEMDQFFLKNNKIIDKVINVLKIKNDDIIMEVGAGIGSVSSHFPKCQKLYLVDLDDGLCRILNYNFRHYEYAEVINGDALEALKNIKCNKIVSNLPFFLTHDVLNILKTIDFEVAVMSVKKEDSFAEFTNSLFILELGDIPGDYFYPKQPFNSKLIMVKKIKAN